jgi:enediyne biosynthesis protein E4
LGSLLPLCNDLVYDDSLGVHAGPILVARPFLMNRRKFIGNVVSAGLFCLPAGRFWAQAQTASQLKGTIRFAEIAQRSGLHFINANSPTPNKNQPETMIGGVALFDYDNDGFLDVYLVNGSALPSLTKESPQYWNRLFRNNRDGTFADVTERAGVAGTGYGMGVAVGDYDNDGNADLFVANVTGNQLLHNNGDGTFTDVTEKAGVSGSSLNGKKMWSVGAGWFDYNNDGLLDLFVVNYCQWEVNKDPFCPIDGKVRGYCHPKYYSPLHNTLYRNNGNGTFTDVSVETGIAAAMGKGMSVSFADMDGNGFLDAFVANDTTRNFLFRNIAGNRFEEIGLEAGVSYAASGTALSGMGADFRDINNDGRPDIWHTAIEHETFPLYQNQGGGAFSDATASSGLTLSTGLMSGWGNGMVDFDNDGWKDLFVARSNVVDNINLVYPTRHYTEPNSAFRNLGNGKFQDVSAAAGPDFQLEGAHRGVAFGDIDNDGRVDAVVTVLGGAAKLFRNISENDHHWILLKFVGTRSNRMGIGAQVRITTDDGKSQWNHVTTAVGYASSSDSRVHFGLGTNRRIREISIRWPSGVRQEIRNVEADQILTIEEPRQ